MTTAFSLAHLTVLNLAPPDMISLAARTGFQFVGLRLIAVTPTTPGYDLMTDKALMRETKQRMADTGVGVFDIEFVKPDLNTWFGQVSGRARIFGKFKRAWHYAGAVPGASVRSVEAQPPREAARLP
jgi:hypothetical protein